jgi:hypothetical protein
VGWFDAAAFFNSIGQLRSFLVVGANVRFPQEQSFAAGRANDRVSPKAVTAIGSFTTAFGLQS